MGTPHKHAELIKAWADGAQIQYKTKWNPNEDWHDNFCTPSWSDDIEYRIKPKTITYRLYLWKESGGRLHVNTAYPKEGVDSGQHFIKWLGDWVEVEV